MANPVKSKKKARRVTKKAVKSVKKTSAKSSDKSSVLTQEVKILKAELKKVYHQLSMIRETSLKVTTELSLEKLLHTLVETAARYYKADAASCMLWDEYKNYLSFGAGVGFKTNYIKEQRIPSDKIRPLMNSNKDYIVIDNLQKDPNGDKTLVVKEDLVSVLTVFMRLGHVFLGAISIYSRHKKRSFTQDEIDTAQVFARQAAIAVWNAYLYGEIYSEAQIAKTLLQVAEDVGTLDSLEEIINRILMIITRALKFKVSVVFLWDQEKGFFIPAKAIGLPPHRTLLFQTLILRKEELNFSEQELRERKTIMAADISNRFPVVKISNIIGERDLRFVPLIVKKKLLGAIVSAGYEGDDPFDSKSDMFLKGISAQAAIAINDANLYEALDRAFWDIIKSLATAIDAKDHYTHSHSQSVAIYGTAIARAMALPKKEIDLLARACLLHDLGKIGIADNILKKVTPLTPEERLEIKKHPVIGENILNSIHSLDGVARIVRHHHENFDGSGYPDQLKGEEIPLYSRILMIADSFDAMTSERPYREAMTRRQAIKQLKVHAGYQFDPELVKIFITTLDIMD